MADPKQPKPNAETLPELAAAVSQNFEVMVTVMTAQAQGQLAGLTNNAVHTGEQLTGPLGGSGKSSEIEIG